MKPANILTLFTIPAATLAGPTAWGICHRRCASLVNACYSASEAVQRHIPAVAPSLPTVVIGCSSAFRSCQDVGTAALFVHIPFLETADEQSLG